MLYRLIIATVYHDRMGDFEKLLRDGWKPILERLGIELIGVWENFEPAKHEIIGLMRCGDIEQLSQVNERLAQDPEFSKISEEMRPLLQATEVRLLKPLDYSPLK